jgi:hypothetical protein
MIEIEGTDWADDSCTPCVPGYYSHRVSSLSLSLSVFRLCAFVD